MIYEFTEEELNTNKRGMLIFGYAVVALYCQHDDLGVLLATGIAGIGLGMLPNINAMAAQFAATKNLLGLESPRMLMRGGKKCRCAKILSRW